MTSFIVRRVTSSRFFLIIVVFAISTLLRTPVYGQDVVEFVNGTTLAGKVLAIRTSEKQFDFESKIGARTIKKTYAFSMVHAVTLNGKRHELTAKGASNFAEKKAARTRAEVRQIIDEQGSMLPDWYESTHMNLPATLDLTWPLKPVSKGWNNRLNIGQYIWDIINPNPSRWRQGVKLVHEVIETHKDDLPLLRRDQKALGRMYFHLLKDFSRAAYWLEQSQAAGSTREGVMLAECYFRLGNREMALELLKQPTLPPEAIKLLAELGDLKNAIRLADAYSGSSAEPNALLLAGDALRNAKQFAGAIKRYEGVLASDKARNKDYRERFCNRAQDSIDAIKLADKAVVSKVADGSYQGSGMGYNGRLQVEVVVNGRAIKSLQVTKHNEKQFYSALDDTPKQIIQKQTVQGIDGFSGATITSAAIVNATAQALASGAE